MSESTGTQARTALAIANKIRGLLAGLDPAVQGAVLVDLNATHLAGHFCRGNPEATRELRERLLTLHCEAVRQMIPAEAARIGTDA